MADGSWEGELKEEIDPPFPLSGEEGLEQHAKEFFKELKVKTLFIQVDNLGKGWNARQSPRPPSTKKTASSTLKAEKLKNILGNAFIGANQHHR